MTTRSPSRNALDVNPRASSPWWNSSCRSARVLGPLTLALAASVSIPTLAHAATNCVNMFANDIAATDGTADCALALSTPPPSCLAGGALTANNCALFLAKEPFSPAPSPANDMTAEYTWMCPNSDHGCQQPKWARCADGTRPSFYYDAPATPSDKWLFYWSGGGGCIGQGCITTYASNEATSMSTCLASQSCLVNEEATFPAGIPSSGVLADDPANPFADYNRVFVRKCTYDAHRGDAIETNVLTPSGVAVGEIYHQGHRSLRYMFNQLANGGIGDLPDLSDASHVVLIGNSGGGKGLTHLGDRFREYFDGLTNNALVRLVVDGHFLPMLEHEGAVNLSHLPVPLVPPTSLYDVPWLGSGTLPLDENSFVAPYDNTIYQAGGRGYDFDQAWGAALDTSCEDVHGVNDPICHDEMHVLLNHVTTPFFVHMDLQDNVWQDGTAIFSPSTTYNWHDFNFFSRIQSQLDDWATYYDSDSELATGADTSAAGVGNDLDPSQWERGIWGPSCGGPGSHTTLLNDSLFDQVEMEPCLGCAVETLGQVMLDWVEAGIGVEAIEGIGGWSTLTGFGQPC